MEEFYLHRDAVTLYCRKYGSGAPVILIHGACTDGSFFDDTAQILADSFTVVTYDRRGSGRSSDAADHDYSVAAQAEDLHCLIQKIGQPCDLIGHSAGGLIATYLAQTASEAVRKLFLYEPLIPNFISTADQIKLQQIHLLTVGGQYYRAMAQFLTLLGARDSRARGATEAELSRAKRNCFAFLCQEWEDFYSRQILLSAFRQIPVTVGLGENSRASSRWALCRSFAEAISAPIVYFPGGHNTPYDLPKEFAWLTCGILHS